MTDSETIAHAHHHAINESPLYSDAAICATDNGWQINLKRKSDGKALRVKITSCDGVITISLPQNEPAIDAISARVLKAVRELDSINASPLSPRSATMSDAICMKIKLKAMGVLLLLAKSGRIKSVKMTDQDNGTAVFEATDTKTNQLVSVAVGVAGPNVLIESRAGGNVSAVIAETIKKQIDAFTKKYDIRTASSTLSSHLGTMSRRLIELIRASLLFADPESTPTQTGVNIQCTRKRDGHIITATIRPDAHKNLTVMANTKDDDFTALCVQANTSSQPLSPAQQAKFTQNVTGAMTLLSNIARSAQYIADINIVSRSDCEAKIRMTDTSNNSQIVMTMFNLGDATSVQFDSTSDLSNTLSGLIRVFL